MDPSDLLPLAMPVLCIGSTLVLGLGVGYLGARRRAAAWTEFATRTGLSFQPGRFFFVAGNVSGTYEGFPVRLYTYSTGGSKNRTTYTRLELAAPHPEGTTLNLSRESSANALFRKIGVDDVELGDPTFDEHFYVKCKPEDFAARMLSHELRGRLIRDLQGRLSLWRGKLHVTRRGVDLDSGRLQNHLELLASLAAAAQSGGAVQEREPEAESETQWGFGWDDEDDGDGVSDDPYLSPARPIADQRMAVYVVIGVLAALLLAGVCAAIGFGLLAANAA